MTAADDPRVVHSVRMVISTDWDAGFQLAPRAEPLPDVAPGAEYTTVCMPQRSIMIRDVVVHDFQLVKLANAVRVAWPTAVEGRSSSPLRVYRLDAPITVPAGDRVVALLRNDSTVARKQKVATLVREDPAAARVDPVPIGRAEDAVPCPACGKEARDSCDGPTSHPSRFARYAEHARRRKGPDQ